MVEKYTVSDLKQEIVLPIIIVAEYGDKLEEPEPPILAGQIFAGWYKTLL